MAKPKRAQDEIPFLDGGEGPPTWARLVPMVQALVSGVSLDPDMRQSIAHALNYLGYRLICDELDAQLRKPGRHTAQDTRQAALVTKVLVDRYGVSIKTAARCAIPRATEAYLGRVTRAYHAIKHTPIVRYDDEALILATQLEPAVRAACEHLPKSSVKRNK